MTREGIRYSPQQLAKIHAEHKAGHVRQDIPITRNHKLHLSPAERYNIIRQSPYREIVTAVYTRGALTPEEILQQTKLEDSVASSSLDYLVLTEILAKDDGHYRLSRHKQFNQTFVRRVATSK